MAQSGTMACAVQPYFTGFAFSAGEPGSLVYDFQKYISDGDVRLYDGFAEYTFRPSGDVFAAMDLGI